MMHRVLSRNMDEVVEKTKDRYITIQSVAETLSCTEQHIYFLIREGSLKSVKIGNRAVRISEKSLLDFIAKNTIDPDDFFDPDAEKKDSANPQAIARSTWMSKTKSSV